MLLFSYGKRNRSMTEVTDTSIPLGYGLDVLYAVHYFKIGRHSAMHAYHEPSQATVPMHHSMTGQHMEEKYIVTTSS
jgi:hypothetical protein